MSPANQSSLGIVAYLALFAIVGVLFLFVNLIVGRLLRPVNPHDEKLEIYECGEPTIGSSFVQFDLRFYVVALLFIIFDVEVAFFFPWATIFGKSVNLASQAENPAAVVTGSEGDLVLTQTAAQSYREMGVRNPQVPTTVPASLSARAGDTPKERSARVIKDGSTQLAMITIVDIGVFFAVLLVGFAYVWRRGDLDWVRAVDRERAAAHVRQPTLAEPDRVLSA